MEPKRLSGAQKRYDTIPHVFDPPLEVMVDKNREQYQKAKSNSKYIIVLCLASSNHSKGNVPWKKEDIRHELKKAFLFREHKLQCCQ